MDNDKVSEIKDLLKSVLRNKFKNYKPESIHMPFHTKLLGKNRLALYNFIHSLNTNFGSTIFEPVAYNLAKYKYIAHKQASVGNIVTKKAQRVIQDIMDNLESGNTAPNKQEEVKAIMEVAHVGDVSDIKPTRVDLFLQNNKEIYLIDIKTVKPNKSNFKEIKRTLLTWIAAYTYKNPDVNIHSLIAIPYNPYEPKPYRRWTMAGMIDLEEELKVARDFWDFIGGENSYDMLLYAFEEVGQEMRDEIDDCCNKFF